MSHPTAPLFYNPRSHIQHERYDDLIQAEPTVHAGMPARNELPLIHGAHRKRQRSNASSQLDNQGNQPTVGKSEKPLCVSLWYISHSVLTSSLQQEKKGKKHCQQVH
jgi:hypothetical protein